MHVARSCVRDEAMLYCRSLVALNWLCYGNNDNATMELLRRLAVPIYPAIVQQCTRTVDGCLLNGVHERNSGKALHMREAAERFVHDQMVKLHGSVLAQAGCSVRTNDDRHNTTQPCGWT